MTFLVKKSNIWGEILDTPCRDATNTNHPPAGNCDGTHPRRIAKGGQISSKNAG